MSHAFILHEVREEGAGDAIDEAFSLHCRDADKVTGFLARSLPR